MKTLCHLFFREQFTDIAGWLNTRHRAQKYPIFFVSWPLGVKVPEHGNVGVSHEDHRTHHSSWG